MSSATFTLFLQPKARFFDNNGLPLAGGFLYSYQAGTTTPLATYTDSSGGTPNTNPVVLDATGQANIWLGANTYKFTLTDSLGNVLWTADQVMSIQAVVANQLNVAGALAVTNNLSDVASVSASLQNLGIQPFTYQTKFSFTNNQVSTNLTGEILDPSLYTSAIYEYEVEQAPTGSYLFATTAYSGVSAGDTYTNNGVTYTVLSTFGDGLHLVCSGAGAPAISGTLVRASGTGSATITFSKAVPTYTIFGNGSFQVQYLNASWQLVKRADYDNGTPHGIIFSLSQSGVVGQLKAAETGGFGNGAIKIKKHYFFS